MANEFGGLFGSPQGDIAHQGMMLQHAQELHNLGQVAMVPHQIRKLDAESAKLETEAAESERMARLMAGAFTGSARAPRGFASDFDAQAFGTEAKPVSMADQLDEVARLAGVAGLVGKAESLAKTSSLIRAREARAAQSAASRDKTLLDIRKEGAEMIGRTFGNVSDEASWDTANRLYEFQTGQRSPYAGVPYSADLVENIKQNALSLKDQADIEDKDLDRERKENYGNKRLQISGIMAEIAALRLQLEKAREKRLARAGGGRQVSSPNQEEISQAKKIVTKNFPALDATELKDAAFAIASEARALRKQNPALDANTALWQAYVAAQRNGDLSNVSKGIGIAGLGRKDRYTGMGKTPETAAAIPAKQADLIRGRYYTNAQGQVAEWTGKGFRVTGDIRAPLLGDNSATDTEADDDEDE